MEGVYSITIVILALFVAGLVGILFFLFRRHRQSESKLILDLARAEAAQRLSQQRLEAALIVTHQVVEAHDEQQIIDTLLTKTLELTGAVGVSFVPLDDNNRPMALFKLGEFPSPIPDAWLEYLASPNVRRQCAQCDHHTAHDQTCSLLQGPFSNNLGLYCFPLHYAEKELGLLNLYLPGQDQLEENLRAFLTSLTEIIALALEGERLRHRELDALGQLRIVKEKQELRGSLISVLENLQRTLGIKASLFIPNLTEKSSWIAQIRSGQVIACGSINEGFISNVESEVRLLSNTVEPVLRFSSLVDRPEEIAWLMAPVRIPNRNEPSAVVHLAHRDYTFSLRRVQLIQSVSEQIALLVNSVDLLAGLEYKSMMDERTRLAREIHDGLAQTLGFLKLQAAQMYSHLERNDLDRLRQALKLIYDALATAYQDVRLSIDGLRINPFGQDGYKLENWLAQTVDDYADQPFDIKIEALDVQVVLQPEVHAQLIRIVQEALSNIRKHAQAGRVWISCVQDSGDLVLEIRDNGLGFAPGDVPDPSRHGLRGMRERAELLGADFQVISMPGKGTTVRVRMPLDARDQMEV